MTTALAEREAADLAPERGQAPAVRAPSPDEAAAARRLQRDAFALPEEGLAGHPGEREELRVLVRESRVVSCLTVLHARLRFASAELAMAGIRHVATAPDEQNHGYGSELMRDTLRWARAQGIAVSVLFPFSFRYYRKFGYELGGNHCQFWCRPNALPAYSEAAHVRVAGPADAGALTHCWQRVAQEYACTLGRQPDRWRTVLADPMHRVMVAPGEKGVSGFAVLDETRDSYGGRLLRVLDLGATDRRAWRALIGHLASLPVEGIEWLASASALAASGLLRSPAPLREGFKPRGIATVRPMWQLRVLDARRALEALLPGTTGGLTLAVQVRDDLLPENTRPVTVAADKNGVHIRAARPGDPTLTADIQIFSQLVCGYVSPTDAVSQGLASVSGPDALEAADQLFPSGEPFIPELDRF